MDFCHLHTHNEYSLLDGLGKAEDYAKRAKELGQEYLALTNHGNVDGLIKFQNVCNSENIKPLMGCELYVVGDMHQKEKGDIRKHLVALVENMQGWHNLLRMMSLANLEGFYRRPRVSADVVRKHSEGLVFLSACSSSIITIDWGMKLFVDLYKKYPGKVFLEIMPINMKSQVQYNEFVYRLHRKTDIPLVATNDCHYVLSSSTKTHEVLLAMQSKAKWDDLNRWRFEANDLYLKDQRQMITSFKSHSNLKRDVCAEAMGNTMLVARICEGFKIPKQEVVLPSAPGFEDKNDAEELRKMCRQFFKDKILPRPDKQLKKQEYKSRMDEELDTIINLGFERYFLIVWEMITWCRKNNILVGPGRGSVSGSLVAYLLGITMVDPIEHGLLFARFISPARIDLPDIDMDFEDRKRWMIREHLEKIYGKDRVAGVSTFATLKGKGAIRDVARVFDIPYVDVDKAAKSIVTRGEGDMRSDLSIADAFETFEDGIAFKKKYPDETKIAIELEGQVKGVGQHAAAMVVSGHDLTDCDRAHLRMGKDENKPIINWHKDDVEYVGLMKLDVLGLNTLTVISEIIEEIEHTRNKKIDLSAVPLNDKKLLSEFGRGNSVGCFQFGSPGLRRYLSEFGIDEFQELAAANALWRPGTLRTGMATEFVMRKNGQMEIPDIHPMVTEITKDTYGVLLYQEQIMFFMYRLAGLGWKTADNVRKVVSKKKGTEQFDQYRDMFVDGCLKQKTLTREQANEVWEKASAFGHYGFNKSHAVAYAMIAYWCMYFKVYYPAEFIVCSLTYSNENKKEELVEEAKRLGFDLMLPKVGISDGKKWVVRDNRLYVPFVEIKGIGEKTVEKVSSKVFFTDKRSANTKYANILTSIWANSDHNPDDAERENVQHLFANFSIMRDRYHKFKKIIARISGTKPLSNIADLNFQKPDASPQLFLGTLNDVKFGYREKILKTKGHTESLGFGDSLGGVYGMFSDKEGVNCMMVFDKRLYHRKKYEVEHSDGQIMLAECCHPHKQSNLLCTNIVFGDGILSANLAEFNLGLVRRMRNNDNKYEYAKDCKNCELHQECKAPVMPSSGSYNVAICGEAPGKDEDREGIGFVGRAGDVLWAAFKEHRLDRHMFHVTNVVKCFPSQSKTPNKKQIHACSKWFFQEIAQAKPALILAVGNSCLKAFKGQESGIMDLNGKTEWLDALNCWVCWAIHPASVLYSPENKDCFAAGIANFAKTMDNLL